ncbi:DUF1206 domain-containing protein [Nocardioides mangrovicus]|uniref:DUF1206 domain-containing protein n=1 Tax=Nocardioides mangrovicus TaxID=2478913 RepID=A0A3L8P752_9ACTN|nr:DUF1206 domain-containing protein [Nocardioides mangrovicus]RLV50208.1 DUF1206 domain-containing protein [Nocardioides mangrovicus]
MTPALGLGSKQVRSDDAVDAVARVGLSAYGVVHLLVAVLAVRLALGNGGGSASQKGALAELARQPFGLVMVWAVSVGLFCLALWRAEQAAVGYADADGAERVRKRATAALKAVIYVALGVSGIKIALGSGSSGKGSDGWTAQLMDLPGGQVLVVLVGLAVVGAGGYLAYLGITGEAKDKLDAEGRSGDTGRAFVVFGTVGYVAKGVSIALVGGLFVYAGVTHDPDKSGGLDQALHTVLREPFGVVLLLLIAAGLACYGVFCLARARHLDR